MTPMFLQIRMLKNWSIFLDIVSINLKKRYPIDHYKKYDFAYNVFTIYFML